METKAKELHIYKYEIRQIQKSDFSSILVFSLLAWFVDVVADVIVLIVSRYDFPLAINIMAMVNAGVTPIVYLIGGKDLVQRARNISSWTFKTLRKILMINENKTYKEESGFRYIFVFISNFPSWRWFVKCITLSGRDTLIRLDNKYQDL